MNMNAKIFDVKGKVIIITGGAGVLGSFYAEVLSEAGANVVIADLQTRRCETLARELKKKYHTDPSGILLDLTKKESVQKLAAAVMKKYKKIDVLINNAATKSKNFFAPFESFPLEDWNAVMAVNITGMFLMAQAAVPHMQKNKDGGIIINISSYHGLVGPTTKLYEGAKITTPAVYSVSKAGVVNFTRWLCCMYAEKNIRTNTLTIGGVSEHQLGGNDFEKKYAAFTPMRRMARKEDLRGPILFLCSDASSYMNGQNLVIDGGWTAW
ncbi:MAG: SDR family oxidoreductase [Nanoarchaeota archaeon]